MFYVRWCCHHYQCELVCAYVECFLTRHQIYTEFPQLLSYFLFLLPLCLSLLRLSLNTSQMRRLRYIYYLLRPSSSTLHLTSWVLFLARYYIKIGVACLGYVMHYNTIESPPNTILNLDNIYFFSIFFFCFLRMHRLIWLMFPCGLYVVMRSMESVDWKWQKKRERMRRERNERKARMSDKSCF